MPALIERAPLRGRNVGDIAAVTPEGATPAASAAAPAAKAHDPAAPTTANPYAGASLVPMLVGCLVLIVVAMVVAVALS